MTEEELKVCLSKAWSYESRAGHEAEDRAVEEVGRLKEGNHIWILYKDSEGGCWYESRFAADTGEISEYEKVFGHKKEACSRKRT